MSRPITRWSSRGSSFSHSRTGSFPAADLQKANGTGLSRSIIPVGCTTNGTDGKRTGACHVAGAEFSLGRSRRMTIRTPRPKPGASYSRKVAKARLLVGALGGEIVDRRRKAGERNRRVGAQPVDEQRQRLRPEAPPDAVRLADQDVDVDRSRRNLGEPEGVQRLAKNLLPAQVADRPAVAVDQGVGAAGRRVERPLSRAPGSGYQGATCGRASHSASSARLASIERNERDGSAAAHGGGAGANDKDIGMIFQIDTADFSCFALRAL